MSFILKIIYGCINNKQYKKMTKRMRLLNQSVSIAILSGCVSFIFANSTLAQVTCGNQDIFVDSVIQYNNNLGNCAPTHPNFTDPKVIFGPPDWNGSTGSVALGSNGMIQVGFSSPITNSGDTAADLLVTEVGPFVEAMSVALRPADAGTLSVLTTAGHTPNADGFIDAGGIGGAIATIDMDAAFPGFAAKTLKFDAIQLLDLGLFRSCPVAGPGPGLFSEGADVDSICGFFAAPQPPTPVPTLNWQGIALLVTLLAGFAFYRRRRVVT